MDTGTYSGPAGFISSGRAWAWGRVQLPPLAIRVNELPLAIAVETAHGLRCGLRKVERFPTPAHFSENFAHPRDAFWTDGMDGYDR